VWHHGNSTAFLPTQTEADTNKTGVSHDGRSSTQGSNIFKGYETSQLRISTERYNNRHSERARQSEITGATNAKKKTLSLFLRHTTINDISSRTE
jgi:hypothetical protein